MCFQVSALCLARHPVGRHWAAQSCAGTRHTHDTPAAYPTAHPTTDPTTIRRHTRGTPTARPTTDPTTIRRHTRGTPTAHPTARPTTHKPGCLRAVSGQSYALLVSQCLRAVSVYSHARYLRVESRASLKPPPRSALWIQRASGCARSFPWTLPDRGHLRQLL